MVVEALQGQFVGALLGKRLLCQPITRLIKARHRGTQRRTLDIRRQQFELQGQFHAYYISGIIPNIKGCMPLAAAEGIAQKTGQPFFPHQPTETIWLEHPERSFGESLIVS
jgi:hypothetical protein